MLLDSDRFIDGDLEAWHQAEKMDALHWRLPGFRRREEEALGALRAFLDASPAGYLGVSWGKDSVVAAHILARLGRVYPVVWVKIWPLYNPDCERVRDAFLAEYDVDYHEIEVEWCPDQIRAWAAHTGGASLGYSPVESAAGAGFAKAARLFGDRHVSGVRAEESGTRKIAMRRWGHATDRTARPIGWWSTPDVFAYLHYHGLPVHPAYAMTRGGLIDRLKLRVDALGGGKGCSMGYPRDVWEGRYYPDRVAEIGDLARRVLAG